MYKRFTMSLIIHFIFLIFVYPLCFLQTHLTFGKEFTEAVELKQVAQQEAERARFVVEKVSAGLLHWARSCKTNKKTNNL